MMMTHLPDPWPITDKFSMKCMHCLEKNNNNNNSLSFRLNERRSDSGLDINAKEDKRQALCPSHNGALTLHANTLWYTLLVRCAPTAYKWSESPWSACGGLTVHMYAIRTAISHEPALLCQLKGPFPMAQRQFGSYDSFRERTSLLG